MIATSTAIVFYNVLLVLAVICFAVETVLVISETAGKHAFLVPLGLAFLAAAFLALSALK